MRKGCSDEEIRCEINACLDNGEFYFRFFLNFHSLFYSRLLVSTGPVALRPEKRLFGFSG
jgi:hypothetical protein